MAVYTPPNKNNWDGRIDGTEQDVLRWHQVIHCTDLNHSSLPGINNDQKGIAIIGFCSDEGVRRNKGRVGAKDGPAAIRKGCCNFPVMTSSIIIADAGDVICDDEDLEAAQELLGGKVSQIKNRGYFPIVLGGGHEVAFANFLGIKSGFDKKEFGIINFDAHFDLRKPGDAGVSSGTGIWQVHEYCKKAGTNFHYLALGIQQYSNTRRLFDTLKEMDAEYFLADQFTDKQSEHILHVINCMLGNAGVLQLTIDMDVFAVAHAPGVSAQAFSGIAPGNMFKQFVHHIIASGKVATIDIAETNPVFDIDARTSRLAAAIVFDIVQAIGE